MHSNISKYMYKWHKSLLVCGFIPVEKMRLQRLVGKRLQNSGHFLVFTVHEQGGLGFFQKVFKHPIWLKHDCHDYHRCKGKKVVRVGESLEVVLSMILVFWRWILIGHGWICRIIASKHRRTRLGVPRGLAVPRGRGSVAVTSWRGCTWDKK